MATAATIQLPPLAKESMSQLVAEAKRLGVDPGHYARQLIEDSLAFQREAEESSFAEIMEAVRDSASPVSDSEITELVKTAKLAGRRAGRRKKR